MATRKRKTTAVGLSSSRTSKSKQSKRQASKETFLRWQRTYEKEYQSMGLLRAEMDDQEKSLVSMLWCVVCRQYENKICGIKNFSRVWIEGSSNHKTSNITWILRAGKIQKKVQMMIVSVKSNQLF